MLERCCMGNCYCTMACCQASQTDMTFSTPLSIVVCCMHRRVTLQRADQIWEHMLEQTELILPLRQHAVAVISIAETSVTLESLQNPWLNLLFRAPASHRNQPMATGPPPPAS